MIDYKFVFDLDSTITKEEVLPLVAKEIGLYEEIQILTEKAMNGLEDFSCNFINRVNMLKDIPLEKIHKIVEKVELNEYIEKFILENKEKCYIVTGNLDIIIKPILKRLNMEDRYFSCKGIIKNNKIHSVTKVINKKDVVKNFNFKFVAVGDGDNDIDMIKLADVGIGFGGSREISCNLKNSADYVIYDDKELYRFLYNLMRG
ncbi:HAD-IB family phosphatase [uncultured Tyzzerella sp.]|uniref:HAD-IB family phosphatase n=1 Tax=uncultured Tyzzerella sp. TaxID=2321398 RepID=UPI002942D959|nr:HAD-IB family phosphatase [uncultured Tyzzerella sp.]